MVHLAVDSFGKTITVDGKAHLHHTLSAKPDHYAMDLRSCLFRLDREGVKAAVYFNKHGEAIEWRRVVKSRVLLSYS